MFYIELRRFDLDDLRPTARGFLADAAHDAAAALKLAAHRGQLVPGLGEGGAQAPQLAGGVAEVIADVGEAVGAGGEMVGRIVGQG